MRHSGETDAFGLVVDPGPNLGELEPVAQLERPAKCVRSRGLLVVPIGDIVSGSLIASRPGNTPK